MAAVRGPECGRSRLLTPSGSSYSVLGQAYAQIKYWDQVLTAGRSEYGTPYVNRQFNRMTPNTFEGVSLEGSFTGLRGKNFDYLIGYLSKIKKRNSDEFIPMSQALGTADNYYGTYISQFLFTAWGASIGLSNYYTPHNLNIFYAEAAWTPKISDRYGLKVSMQYTGQRAVGSVSSGDLLQSVPLAGNAERGATFSHEGSVLSLAYSLTGSSGAIVSPWGSSPSYTNGSIRNGNRPNEQAALLNYSYDFQKLGVPGLSATAIYSYAWDAKDPTTKPAAVQPVGAGSAGRLQDSRRDIQGAVVSLAAQSLAGRRRYERDHAMARDRVLGNAADMIGRFRSGATTTRTAARLTVPSFAAMLRLDWMSGPTCCSRHRRMLTEHL